MRNQPVHIRVDYTNTLPPSAGERSNSQPALMRGVVSIVIRSRHIYIFIYCLASRRGPKT